MSLGKAARKLFPANARIQLREEHPGIKLPGFIGNRPGYLIFSRRAKEIIEKLSEGQKIEYLNFSLINHKGHVHSNDYFIINPVGGFDALNVKASEIIRADDDGRVLDVPTIVLDSTKLERAPHLFRLGQKPIVYLISAALRAALVEANVTNLICLRVPQRPAED